MWEVPEGVTDVFRTNARMLDAVLFVVMNSVEMKNLTAPTGGTALPVTP
jgi:hypothetical protein